VVSVTEDMSFATKAAAWLFMVALGPIHFRGEMVGPTGATDWRQWVAALLGTFLWGAFIVEVLLPHV